MYLSVNELQHFEQIEKSALTTSLTTEQLCEVSWSGGLSWLSLAGVDFSFSVILPGNEEDEEEAPDAEGLLRLLLIPNEHQNKTTKN